MQGRKLRSRLDLAHPDLQAKVFKKQNDQKRVHDQTAKARSFQQGETVLVQSFSPRGPKWVTGNIVEVTGPVSFKVVLSDGTTVRRHQDQIRECKLKDPIPDLTQSKKASSTDPITDSDAASDISVDDDENVPPNNNASSDAPREDNTQAEPQPVVSPSPREPYPRRNRNAPDYFGR